MATALASITPSRIAAAETLADVRGGALLDHAFDKRAAQLDPRDRRWTQELLWGMLRKRGWIDAILASRATGGLTKLDAEIVDLLGSASISSSRWEVCRHTRQSVRRWSWRSVAMDSAQASS